MPLQNSGPVRNYRQLIEYFESVCTNHIAIKQFQTGEISDIDVQTNDHPITEYPLVFLTPRGGQISRDGGSSVTQFDFTLWVMDISKDRESLETNRLSETHDILLDLVSRIALTSYEEVDFNIEFPVLTSSFVERFNNRLTGWAAEITCVLRSPLNLCDAAYS